MKYYKECKIMQKITYNNGKMTYSGKRKEMTEILSYNCIKICAFQT